MIMMTLGLAFIISVIWMFGVFPFLTTSDKIDEKRPATKSKTKIALYYGAVAFLYSGPIGLFIVILTALICNMFNFFKELDVAKNIGDLLSDSESKKGDTK